MPAPVGIVHMECRPFRLRLIVKLIAQECIDQHRQQTEPNLEPADIADFNEAKQGNGGSERQIQQGDGENGGGESNDVATQLIGGVTIV